MEHGVRKYEDFSGRFTSPDPLWEKYYGWSPYHYCRNNPLSRVDPEGKDETIIQETGYAFGEEQKVYTYRTNGKSEFSGTTYLTGTTDKLWNGDKWITDKQFKNEYITPIVNDIYNEGPSKVKINDYGVDTKKPIAENFYNMIDNAAKSKSQGSEQFPYFNDGTKNPFHKEALNPAYSEFLFGQSFLGVNFLISRMIRFGVQQSLKKGGEMINNKEETLKLKEEK